MSVREVMFFMQRVAEEKGLQRKIRALGDGASLEDIIKIGMEAGFEFSEDELQTAFTQDWAARYTWFCHLKQG